MQGWADICISGDSAAHRRAFKRRLSKGEPVQGSAGMLLCISGDSAVVATSMSEIERTLSDQEAVRFLNVMSWSIGELQSSEAENGTFCCELRCRVHF